MCLSTPVGGPRGFELFAAIAYTGATLIVSAILTCLYLMTRPLQERDELKSWRVMIFLSIFIGVTPYGAIEVLTRIVGGPMADAVESAVDDAGIKGKLNYYKVVWFTGDHARVLAITEEPADWGGTERPVIRVKLEKDGEEWRAVTYDIANSVERNKDGIVFPPYW